MSFLGKRFQFRNRSFSPTGPKKRLGSRKPLGRIDEYGPARTISLLVGQNKGLEPRNQTKACARKPSKFSTEKIDDAFLRLRAAQVGRQYVGATRQQGKGWFEGDPESSVAFEIAYIPPEGGGPDSEPTFEAFSKNMNRLAETLAEEFCQDSVLIIRDDGTKRSVAAAVWEPEE